MSKHCGAPYTSDDIDGIANCQLLVHHSGNVHASPGTDGMIIWSDPPAEDEQHESDDRKDDQNRPQHDGGDTPWITIENMHVGVTPDRIITPEIAEILRTLPAAMDNEAQRTWSAQDCQDIGPLERAWNAYKQSVKQTSDYPAAMRMAQLLVDGGSAHNRSIAERLKGDPIMAIDVVIALTDLSRSAGNVFGHAQRVQNLIIDYA